MNLTGNQSQPQEVLTNNTELEVIPVYNVEEQKAEVALKVKNSPRSDEYRKAN